MWTRSILSPIITWILASFLRFNGTKQWPFYQNLCQSTGQPLDKWMVVNGEHILYQLNFLWNLDLDRNHKNRFSKWFFFFFCLFNKTWVMALSSSTWTKETPYFWKSKGHLNGRQMNKPTFWNQHLIQKRQVSGFVSHFKNPFMAPIIPDLRKSQTVYYQSSFNGTQTV